MSFPLIFDSAELSFATQGYGVLSDAISCIVTEELNGMYEFEMQYPANGLHSEYIYPGNIIVCPSSLTSGRQAFRIYQVRQEISGLATVYARHISYDLNGYPVEAFTENALSLALNTLTAYARQNFGCPFTVNADFEAQRAFEVIESSPIRSWFGGREGSLIDVYGGEWEYNNFVCTLKSRRGTDRGARAAYSKNISLYTKDVSNDSQYTHICAVWTDDELGSFRSDYIETGFQGTSKVKFLDVSTEFEEQPTTAQLNAYAEARASQYDSLSLSIGVDVVPLNDLLDVIDLGDTVHVYYQNDMYTSRCVSVIWNVIKEKYDRITVGELKTSFAESISSSVSQDGYVTRKDVQAMIQKSIPSGGSGIQILESGTDNGWEYKKYSDGTYEAVKRLTLSNVSCSTSEGRLYRTGNQSFTNRPSFDNGITSINVSFWPSGSDRRAWAMCAVRPGNSDIGSWAVVSASSGNVSGTLAAVIRGTWN